MPYEKRNSYKKFCGKGKTTLNREPLTLNQIFPHPSALSRRLLSPQPSAIPLHLQSVAALANQLLRSGTSIGANNAEACNAISRQDFRAKSYIALKEARESLYWIELLKRNNYIEERQYQSIYNDAEELVKILVARCKKLDVELNK